MPQRRRAKPSTKPSPQSDPPPLPSEEERKPFPFFSLPGELRNVIYRYALHVSRPLDLDVSNTHLIRPLLSSLFVNRQMHSETYPIFYSQAIRLFPHHTSKFFYTRRPLLARLPRRYRNVVTCLDVTFGPGWSDPPKGHVTRGNAVLGLGDCVRVREVNVLVMCDPSDVMFEGWRGGDASPTGYTERCVDVLEGLCEQLPNLERVVLDAFKPALGGKLVTALVEVVEGFGLRFVKGTRWVDEESEGLETEFGGLRVGTCTSCEVLVV
ncbi:hypothetical protein K470DRAFT_99435 [Piedraia hortae CBS 480.64]|uniref:F-box domain-containing protein n=1 Tax=Piedraia hortae CBS 480.64 TaxID=1314780 RepID=A0A6A7BY21_9PEZI|nr:hypothetical protein K470DRAFT_99435 [Piedraia hortae CBS 480.64]